MERNSAQAVRIRERMQSRMKSHHRKIVIERYCGAIEDLKSVINRMGKAINSGNGSTMIYQRDAVQRDAIEAFNKLLHISDDIDGLSKNFKKSYNGTFVEFVGEMAEQVNRWCNSIDFIIGTRLDDMKATDASELAALEDDLKDILEG